MAIIRTNPYIMATGGAIRGSNCTSMRLNCNSIGPRGMGGPVGNFFSGTNMTPGGALGRFHFASASTCDVNSLIGTSMFAPNSGVSMANGDGNGNATNIVGE